MKSSLPRFKEIGEMDQLDMTVEQNDDLSEEIRQAEAQIEAGNGIDHKEAKRQVREVIRSSYRK